VNTLQKAIAKRDEFLATHPNLVKYQQEIDRILDKTPVEDRGHVLGILMSLKLVELQTECLKLTKAVTR